MNGPLFAYFSVV